MSYMNEYMFTQSSVFGLIVDSALNYTSDSIRIFELKTDNTHMITFPSCLLLFILFRKKNN